MDFLVIDDDKTFPVSQSPPHHNFFEIASFEHFNYRCSAAPSPLSDQAAPTTKGFGAENK